MKQPYLLLTLLISICFFACKKSSTNPQNNNGKYSITVTNGYSSGSFSTGDTAYIFSNPPTQTQVFDKWTGDVSNLVSPNEWRSALKMPASNINVTATYKTVSPVTWTNVLINGSQVYYYVPANYRGILLAFHGTGGAAINWTTEQAENVNFCNYAIANGYAMVITESKNRTTMQWDLSSTNNVDITNIDVILNSLQTAQIISASKPLYGVGMSDGSAFCSLISYLRNYHAQALYCLGGIDKVFPLTSVPTIWNMAVNDVTDDPNRQAEATADYNILTSRNIACQYYLNTPTPLYTSRFSIIPSIGTANSSLIYNDLKSSGYLNTNSFFNIDPVINTQWQSAIAAPYNPPALEPIGDQLAVAYAQHKFYKDSNYRTIAFLNRF
jgi:hypothetical protein